MSCGLMNPKLISVADPFQMIILESETVTAILERTDVKCSVNQLAACGTWPACGLYVGNNEKHLVTALANGWE